MKVLLLAPEATGGYKKVGPKTGGLGLLYLAASLKAAGHSVRIEFANKKNVLKILDDYKPHVVGVTSVTATYNAALRIVKSVKEYSSSIVTIMGGHHVTFTVNETLNESCVDYIIRGEGEAALPSLLKSIEEGDVSPTIDGVCFKRGDAIYNGSTIAMVENINDIPLPDRAQMRRFKEPAVTIIGQRGCPFKCTFCSVSNFFGGRWRRRDVSSVLDELESIDDLDKVDFHETLTSDVEWIKGLCDGIMARGLRFRWWCGSRVDVLDRHPELIKIMKRAGCQGIVLGLESGVQEIIDSFNKHITLEQALRVSQKMKEEGLCQNWFLIIGSGNQYDTPDYIRQTIEFMRPIPYDYLNITILTPYPGTALHTKLKSEGRIINENWAYYDGGHCVYMPSGMMPKEMDEWWTTAYKELFICRGFGNLMRLLRRRSRALPSPPSILTHLFVYFWVAVLRRPIPSFLFTEGDGTK